LENGIDLRQGAAGALEIVVGGPAAVVTGVVHNDKGEPMPGAVITLVPKNTKGRTDLFRSSTSDQNGNIRIRGVVPGEYKAYAWEDIEPYSYNDPEVLRQFEDKGKPVHIAESDKKSEEVRLIPAAAP
jgi:protocatechuate 3,4-dioxygenase beta subunit